MNSIGSGVALVVSIGLCAASASAQDAPQAKVDEQILGAAKQGDAFVVSPRGAHLATVTQKGSRFVVVVDGIEGPKFDDVVALENGAKVLFSPDGSRYAYLARSGQEYVLVVDGKEFARPGTVIEQYGSPPVSQLAFTPNSRHIWFLQRVRRSNATGDDYQCVVFDGTLGIPGGCAPILSPDGDHFAYVASNPRDPSQQTVILDGKPAGYSGSDPQFTGDSQHLFVRTYVPLGPNRGQALQILLDGKPWLKAEDATLYIPPVGSLAASVVRRTASGRESFLVVGGKKVEESQSVEIPRVTFSPDGKRYAAECQTAASSFFVVIDGKKGQEYQAISGLAFSPDSSRCAYNASIGGKTFVVVDGEESDGYQFAVEFAFGGGGKRTAYIAQSANAERVVVIDGSPSAHKTPQAAGLVFSADGSRCAYLVSGGGIQNLVLDGVVDAGLNVIPFRSTIQALPAPFVLSHDGKHVARVCAPAGNTDVQQGLFLDGTRVQAGLVFWNPTFTPDGRHLLWMAPGATSSRCEIFVDGQRCAELDVGGVLPLYARTWEMGADGVLTVLGQDGEKLKRLRVTPSAETSVETLLASAAAAGPSKPVK